jgi:hypothetical protein
LRQTTSRTKITKVDHSLHVAENRHLTSKQLSQPHARHRHCNAAPRPQRFALSPPLIHSLFRILRASWPSALHHQASHVDFLLLALNCLSSFSEFVLVLICSKCTAIKLSQVMQFYILKQAQFCELSCIVHDGGVCLNTPFTGQGGAVNE